MTVSMTELMRTVRNCFVSGALDGAWRVSGGVPEGDPPLPAGWVAVEGLGAFELPGGGGGGESPRTKDESPRTDGPSLPDGDYTGRVWLLDPPEDFVRLLGEINAWLAAKDDTGNPVTHRRESFGAYATETSWSVPAGSSGSWEAAFAARLAPFRRMFIQVKF